MKILHSSDWHIGKRLYNKDLELDHRLFFDWLINTLTEQHIEVLIIAGDIFDLAFPSNSSLQLYYQMLTRVQATCCKNVVITGGNHDSVSTLNAPKEILKYLNIHVVGGATENLQDEIVEIKNDSGEIQLVVCAVPFLRDRDIRISKTGETYEERTKAIRDGIAKHYEDLAELIKPYKEQQIPVIATAHLYLSDSSMEKDEKDFYIGGLQQISSNQFPVEFDYLALGHVHRPQIVGGNQRIRYCGCPIHLSFSDRKDDKIVIILNAEKGSELTLETMQVPQTRRLLSFSGSMSEVIAKLSKYESTSEHKNWAEVSIVEEKYDSLLIPQMNRFVESLDNLDILSMKFQFKDNLGGADELFDENVSLKDLKITEVFDKLLEKQDLANSADLKDTFAELLELMH